MNIFAALPSERDTPAAGLIDATHEWGLPGVICPVCGNTWSNDGLAYPLISLSDLPFERDYRIPRAIPLAEFNVLKNRLVPLLPEGTFVLPGTEFGPLVGKASGKFGDFAWLNPWTPLIKGGAYLKLREKGIHLPMKASHKLVFRQKHHDRLFELQVEPFAVIKLAEAPADPCSACGYTQLALPDQVVIDQSSVPEHVDMFRARNFTTLVLATKAFRDLTNELGLTGIEFHEVFVS